MVDGGRQYRKPRGRRAGGAPDIQGFNNRLFFGLGKQRASHPSLAVFDPVHQEGIKLLPVKVMVSLPSVMQKEEGGVERGGNARLDYFHVSVSCPPPYRDGRYNALCLLTVPK